MALGATADSPYLVKAPILITADGASWSPYRAPSKFVDVPTVAVGSIATLWTPASGKRIRLLGLTVSLSAAANLLLEDNAGGNFVLRTPKLLADTPYTFDLGPNGILLAAADRVLKGTSSAAANLTGTLFGVEE